MANTAIYFCGATENYGEFSNFYNHAFSVDGVWYKNAFSYLMKKKQEQFEPENEDLGKSILAAKKARAAMKLGDSIKVDDKKAWDQAKEKLMHDALWYKFTSTDNLRALLISTGNKNIYFASPSDRSWGIGMDAGYARYINYDWHVRGGTDGQIVNADNKNPGKNLLGKVLMRVRTEVAGHTKFVDLPGSKLEFAATHKSRASSTTSQDSQTQA